MTVIHNTDLTTAEARDAFNALAKEIGSGRIFVSLNDKSWARAPALHASVYGVRGMGDDRRFAVEADTFRDLIDEIRAKHAETADVHDKATIRKMALKIIELTADFGECTDAALRQHFDAKEVAQLGERAAADANEIAAGGPFSIVAIGGSNAEAA